MVDSVGLLSQGSYLEVSLTSSGSYSFSSTDNSISRLAGSFIDDGIEIGMTLYTTESHNPGPFVVTAVTALKITTAGTIVTESAAAYDITAYARVSDVASLNTPDGSPAEIDVTHLQSTAREYRNGLRDEGTITGEMTFTPDDAGQKIMRAMQNEKFPRSVRITIPPVDEDQEQRPGYRWTFNGLCRGMPTALAVDDKAKTSFTIRVTGSVTEDQIDPS